MRSQVACKHKQRKQPDSALGKPPSETMMTLVVRRCAGNGKLVGRSMEGAEPAFRITGTAEPKEFGGGSVVVLEQAIRARVVDGDLLAAEKVQWRAEAAGDKMTGTWIRDSGMLDSFTAFRLSKDITKKFKSSGGFAAPSTASPATFEQEKTRKPSSSSAKKGESASSSAQKNGGSSSAAKKKKGGSKADLAMEDVGEEEDGLLTIDAVHKLTAVGAFLGFMSVACTVGFIILVDAATPVGSLAWIVAIVTAVVFFSLSCCTVCLFKKYGD